MQLNHENLNVYQISIEFLSLAFSTIKEIPTGYSFLCDQLKRASLSIPLNIAEGAGRYSKQDQAKFYKIARGSANECAAIFDVIQTTKIVKNVNWQKAKELLFQIVSMLSKMF